MADILLITGMSGAGRSAAAAVLEDLGWYVIDNLPTELVDTIVELVSKPGSGIGQLALVAGRQHVELLPRVAALRGAGHRVRLLYLDSSTPVLVKRYDATRRKHPLDGEADGLVEAIDLERRQLEPVKSAADLVIDTTDLNVHQLKAKLLAAFDAVDDARRMHLAVESFGYKHGLPMDADIVMDLRFLPNPHWDEALRPLVGMDAAVREFVLGRPEAGEFLDRLSALIDSVLPQYNAEGKSYLTIAIGCTGGRHRSVAIAEEIATRIRETGQPVRVSHRDLSRS